MMTEIAKPQKNLKHPVAILAISSVATPIFAAAAFLVTQQITNATSGFAQRNHTSPEKNFSDSKHVEFLALEPLVVNLSSSDTPRHLRLEATLQIGPGAYREIERIRPIIMDVMNTYLRAVEFSELERPTSVLLIRDHLLRRIQTITPEGAVSNLLISSFVIN